MIEFIGLKLERDWEFLRERMDVRLCEDTTGIIAVRDRKEIVGACLCDSWTETSCQVHIWFETPFVIKAGFLHEIAKYVFETAGREVMIGAIPGDNSKALKFDKHIGFTEICRIPDGCAKGVDYVIMTMRKDDCRWLEDYGKAESPEAA